MHYKKNVRKNIGKNLPPLEKKNEEAKGREAFFTPAFSLLFKMEKERKKTSRGTGETKAGFCQQALGWKGG